MVAYLHSCLTHSVAWVAYPEMVPEVADACHCKVLQVGCGIG